MLPVALLLLAASLHAVSLPSENEVAAQQVSACWNAEYSSAPTRFPDFIAGMPPSLKLHAVLPSRKPAHFHLTLVTAASTDRMRNIRHQCFSYPGPLVVAYYLPLPYALTPTDAAANDAAIAAELAALQRLHAVMEARREACQLWLMLLYELIADRPLLHLLPVNALRNAAMLLARSPLVAMLDVDMSLSRTARTALVDPVRVRRLVELCATKHAFVLPALDVNEHLNLTASEKNEVTNTVLAVPADKKYLLRMMLQRGLIDRFNARYFPAGHLPTDYWRWSNTTMPYLVTWQPRYEPWVIVSRHLIPAYDARYRGYSYNKIMHVTVLAASNFTFVVVPDVWLMHRPHGPTAGKALARFMSLADRLKVNERIRGDLYQTASPDSPLTFFDEFFNYTTALYTTSVAAVQAGSYVPVHGPQFNRCHRALSWWGGVPLPKRASKV